MDFNANIGNISKITLGIGGFFSGHCTYNERLDEQLHFFGGGYAETYTDEF